MKIEAAISEWHMLKSWALAEATSQKGALGQAVRDLDPTHPLRRKVLRGEVTLLDAGDWEILVNAIQQTRQPLLAGLIGAPIEWYEAEADAQDMSAMSFIAVKEWAEKWPSMRLVDLCGTRHKQGPEPEFQGWRTSIARPIALGQTKDGPFCLIEGYTRCCTWLRDERASIRPPSTVPLIVGIWPGVSRWASPTGHHWWPNIDTRQASR
jgi:hypothetical protein